MKDRSDENFGNYENYENVAITPIIPTKNLRVVRYYSQVIFRPSQVKKSYGLGNFGLRDERRAEVYLA